MNFEVCDAADCDNEAIEKIEVRAGKHGLITLFVCKNCVSKFQESEKRMKQNENKLQPVKATLATKHQPDVLSMDNIPQSVNELLQKPDIEQKIDLILEKLDLVLKSNAHLKKDLPTIIKETMHSELNKIEHKSYFLRGL